MSTAAATKITYSIRVQVLHFIQDIWGENEDMPIYEYECRKCGEKFESFRGISDNDDKVICPVCGEKAAKRRVSRTFSQGLTTKGNLQFPT